MASLVSSGTQTATIGTEHTLASISSVGVYVLTVDLTNLADGDTVEIRCKRIVKAGGSLRGFFKKVVTNSVNVDNVVAESIPVQNPFTDNPSVQFTLKQTVGTGRNFDWELSAI